MSAVSMDRCPICRDSFVLYARENRTVCRQCNRYEVHWKDDITVCIMIDGKWKSWKFVEDMDWRIELLYSREIGQAVNQARDEVILEIEPEST